MRLKRIHVKIASAVAMLAGVVAFGAGRLSYTSHASGANLAMKVAFPNSLPITKYDPANITLAPQYILLESIYSALVEMDKEGHVIAGVAEKYDWVGDEAHFQIRNNLKTVDGVSVTATDAALSLKRLLIISGNTHGNLKDILCADRTLTKLSDECPGIDVKGNTLILRPGQRKTFLFAMLTAIDFAVIPSGSFDHDTLEIKDFRNTSGPYFVEKDDGYGNMILKANRNHYHYNANAKNRYAEEVTLVPSDPKNPKSSLEMLEQGKVDLLTTIDATRSEDILRFQSDSQNKYVLHKTHNIRTTLLGFTSKGLQKFSKEQRIAIGKRMRHAFLKYASTVEGYQETAQFYPTSGEGGLDAAQSEVLKKVFASESDEKFDGTGLRANLVRVGRRDLFAGMLNEILPGIQVEEGRNPNFVDYSKNPDEMPEMFISAPDTGFMEDIGLISYSLNAGYSPLTKEEREDWLGEYAEQSNKSERLKKLRQLHLDTLVSPVVVPLAVSAYVAIARKPLIIDLSPFCANNPLWQIVKN